MSEPITREEMFLAKAAGEDVNTPAPITRKEQYLKKIAENGGGGAGGGSFDAILILSNDDVTVQHGDFNAMWNLVTYEQDELAFTRMPVIHISGIVGASVTPFFCGQIDYYLDSDNADAPTISMAINIIGGNVVNYIGDVFWTSENISFVPAA